MRSFAAFIINAALLSSSVATARSWPSRLSAIRQRRSSINGLTIYNTQPLQRPGNRFGPDAGSTVSVVDPNWAGALQNSHNITQASGLITVPSVSVPANGNASTEYLGCAWVGIDGDTCGNAILQAGLYWILQNNQTQLFAFYEWYPAPVESIPISVTPGDVFAISLVATSATTGTVNVENQSTGEKFAKSLSSPQALCMENAEWIVEDNEELPFAQFTPVTFSDISWTAQNSTAGLAGATVLNIEQNNNLRTNCQIDETQVQCSWLA